MKNVSQPQASDPALNAVKHGLLAEGLTSLDDQDEYEVFVESLVNEHQPSGELENFLVRRIALHMVRLGRAVILEARFVDDVLVPEENTRHTFFHVRTLNDHYQRYETAIENKLYRALQHLQNLQK